MTFAAVPLSASLLIASLLSAAAQPAPPKPGQKPAASQPAAQPAPPTVFPCRTQAETCHLALVADGRLLVIFSNAPNARGIDEKPIEAAAAGGAKIDLAPHAGRLVMLTGAYDPKAGLTDAEIVEVASPLVSLVVKAQLGGGEEPGAKPAPRRR